MHDIPQPPLLQDLRAHAWQRLSTEFTPPSQFEQLASAAAGISPHRLRLLGMLLAASSPTACGGRAVLRPIWATEALNRAYVMVRLIGDLEQRAPRPCSDMETGLGGELAATYSSLAISSDEELRPCSGPLRGLVRDLVELFEPVPIALTTCVDRLTLPAFRQRALVLLASEIVSNALLHGFRDRPFGRIKFELAVLGRHTARLTVADDGGCVLERARDHAARCSVVHYLADLLESDMVYRARPGGGMIAEMEFPAEPRQAVAVTRFA
jgi:hypothetical protein